MLNSRDISLLRPDVAANCRKLIALCGRAGYQIAVTSTVRDDEYQQYLYAQGRSRSGSIVTNSPTPTFHWDKAGLAFDVCQNIRGREYSDEGFWRTVSRIGKDMGFTWGGNWKSFADKPHFQWDGNGKYTGAMVRGGCFPPQMPLYEEEDMQHYDFSKMTDAQVQALYNRLQEYLRGQNATLAKELAEAKTMGITDGTYPLAIPTREQVAVMVKRGVAPLHKAHGE